MEENKEIIQEDIKKENVKKNITKKKIPMYVYIVGIVVVLILILIIALAVMANSDEEVPPVEQPVVEENVNENKNIFDEINARRGDDLKVSELVPYRDGTFPCGLSKNESNVVNVSLLDLLLVSFRSSQIQSISSIV